MGSKNYFILAFNILILLPLASQVKKLPLQKDTTGFNFSYWGAYAEKNNYSPAEKDEFVEGKRNEYLREKGLLKDEHEHDDNLIWVPVNNSQPSQNSSGKYSQNTINAGPCVNIDFESGTFNGWTLLRGYNPLYNPTVGCCSTTQTPIDIAIVTGGNDPFGGFPRVYPGGGSFSARVGSNATGGFADRIEQTFFVTPANANFTYRYAIVLNDGGHSLADQPRFTSEIIDTLGNPVNCTFYQVSAGSGVPGFIQAPNNSSVIYKTWTNVAIDLTPNIGQNVTLRFTVYDCKQTGHFAYAYIDGLCTNFVTSQSDTTCVGVPYPMCAPAGFSVFTWNGPGVTNDSNQCILANLPGVYTCTTLLIPGCPGPTFTHTLVNHSNGILSFTPVSAGACSNQYTFNPTIIINAPIVNDYFTNYIWTFGDGTSINSTTNITPTHNYPGPGTYPVKLKTITTRGCVDSVTNFITIFPPPSIAFTPPSNCVATSIQFSNTSTIPVGTINSYTWNFIGTGATSNLTNPTYTYNTPGTYSVNLSATSNQGCVSSATGTLGIFPPPTVSFAPSALCDANGTSFAPSSQATVATGFLNTFSWNFGDGGTSNVSNPVHTYTTAGTYTVTFTAVTNHNCSATHTDVVTILPSPNMAFSTASVNACTPTNFTFTNNSNIAFGSSFTHTWSFMGSSGTTTTTATNPIHNFPSTGSYTVKLIGVSNQGCPDTAVQYITIFPLPIVNFNRADNCESAIFGVTTTPISGTVTSYSWNFGDPGSGAANTSTLQNPTHQFPGPGAYSIQVTIVSNQNCTATFPNVVTVYPNPFASISPLTPATNCTRDFTFSSANSTVANIGASAITNYTWNLGGLSTSTLANPSYTFPSHGIYTVDLTVQTNRDCFHSTAITLTVHPLPVVSLSTQAFCQNVPATFTTAATIPSVGALPSSIITYSWNYGDSFSGGGPSPAIPAHIYGSGITYTATFTAFSNMGCQASVSRTVDVHPIPTVTFNTTSNMCYGGATTYTGSATVPSGFVVGQVWDFGDGSFAGGSSSATHTYATHGTYPVTFSVSTEYECWGILTKNVTVYPLPAVTFTTNGGCLNTASNFSEGSTIAAPSSISSWSWDFGDGSPISSTQNPTHTYQVHGLYNPTLTVTSNNNCTATAVQGVTIHPLPTIAFSPTGACVGTSVQFTNTSAIPLGTINSFVWNFADATTTVNLVNPAHTYTNYGTYNVTLTATSNQGCAKTHINNVVIHPYPTVTLTPINNSCVLDSVKIYPNVTIGGVGNPITGYTVSFGDGSAAHIYTQNALPYTVPHVYSGYNTYTITVSAVSNGCRKDTTASISIYPKPFANFVASKFCQGDSTTFVNTSTISSTYSIAEHYWYFNSGVDTSGTKNPKYVYTSPGQYSVSLTEFSYPEAGVTCSVTATKVITVNPLPIPAFVSNTVCSGSPTTFSNTTANTSNITGWSWYFYNNNQLNSVAQNPVFTYSASPSLTFQAKLKALNSFGCRDSVTNIVSVYANPVASFTATENCFKSPTIFNNQSTPGSGSVLSHSWSINNTTHLSFAENPIHTFTAAGVFSVYLTTTSELGCKNTAISTVTVNPLPFVNFSSDEVCIGKPTNFYNLSSGNITLFNWTFGDPGSGTANTSTLQTPTHTYPTSGVFIATLIAVTDRNCLDDTIKSIIVHNNPIADFTVSTICVGDNTPFVNLSSSGDGTIATSMWDFNGDNIIDIEAKNPEYKYELNGNYNVRLVATTQYGCVNDVIKQVTANPKPVVSYSTTAKSGCPPLCVTFKNNSTIAAGGTITSVVWDFGNGNPASTNSDPTPCFESGSYDINLTLISDKGCTTRHTNPSYVNVYSVPQADFRVEPEQVDEDEPVVAVFNQAHDADFVKYYISDGSSFGSPNFTHYIKNLKQTKPMIVQIVKNKYGCIDTLFKLLEIKPAFVIYIPNVFTPNGDGLNDEFTPKGVGIIKFSMQIYDRWGHVVFRTDEFEKTWDGGTKGGGENMSKQDVYTWKAQVTDVFNKTHNMVGHVSVIR